MFIEDFLTHKLVKNKGQLPQYYVRGAHNPIIPRSVFDRTREEIWLRGQMAAKGGTRFGSRRALSGRTYCRCGGRMQRTRRKERVWRCKSCGFICHEQYPRQQLLEAIRLLPSCEEDIRRKWQALSARADQNQKLPDLRDGQGDTAERLSRAEALRRQWQLGNLLPAQETCSFRAACSEEADFISRTAHRIREESSDDALIRILDRIIIGQETGFKGGYAIRAPKQPLMLPADSTRLQIRGR